MPKVSDLIQHINDQYPVLDLTAANSVKGLYYYDSFSDLSSTPVQSQSTKAIALVDNTIKLYHGEDGDVFTDEDSWEEVAKTPTDYDELLGINLIDNGQLQRYELILYDTIDGVFKKANLDSLFGGLGVFIAQQSAGGVTIQNPTTGIAGDFDGDGAVGTNDLLALLSFYNNEIGQGGVNALNVDTVVTIGNTLPNINVNYGSLTYNDGDKLYLNPTLTSIQEAGNYLLNIEPGIDPTDITNIDSVGYFSLQNPDQEEDVIIQDLSTYLPAIKIGSIQAQFIQFAGLEGVIDCAEFGVDVRFYEDGVELGNDPASPTIADGPIPYAGGVLDWYSGDVNFTAVNSIVRQSWDILSADNAIDEIRINPWIKYSPESPIESAVSLIAFPSDFYVFTVDPTE